MGGCVSKSNEEPMYRPCLGMGCCGSKMGRRTSSGRIVSLNNLVSIPNRITSNGKSKSSCIFTQQGRKGVNQDSMIVWEDFMSKDVTFCGVFDGHGPHGHLVSRKVRESLPVRILSFLQSKPSKSDSQEADKEEEEEEASEEDKLKLLWEEAFLKAFSAMDKELRSHPNVECFCSGSTAVTVIKQVILMTTKDLFVSKDWFLMCFDVFQGSNLFMGNIGDSRAILGSKDSNDSLVATQLTVDLKPDLPREAERIKQCKGRVFALEDEPEVPRVWLPYDNAPGLAMARAFGDFCLKDYGVISVPEFSHRVLTDRDQFIVLASDGVWDVLSNEEVVEVVASAPRRASAARLVVDAAAREWKLKYPTSKMDDCAVVCLFLDEKMDSDPSDYEEQGYYSSATNAVEESDESQVNAEPCLQRNVTVRASTEKEKKSEGEQNWSGLEGVTRVNSLVQLPRFSGEETKT
ncbi:probable protein phosphatase 2C 1 isoform X1 [Brassica napus]|uniref:probable protein phosphatase 2C 1 isoform X1 n=1 Tax=Brassica napus TaxID=3708 RepID=UPI00207AEB22|nr:probable protein phosphatase 2C 1 isoform X1 [Brassica napus]XP_048613658.1 probable protein phosphatase 2C 1 isoform X1 [Brassica napus]